MSALRKRQEWIKRLEEIDNLPLPLRHILCDADAKGSNFLIQNLASKIVRIVWKVPGTGNHAELTYSPVLKSILFSLRLPGYSMEILQPEDEEFFLPDSIWKKIFELSAKQKEV